jgi:hypothetical protein
MQKTATWYALRNFCIPAFGVESSKNIASLELKVLYHNYAVNEFMQLMDIVPEYPPIYTLPAVLGYALITINGKSVTVQDGEVLHIQKNDRVSVTHIESNYERGIICDVLGYGNLNDLNREFEILYTTKIAFRKEEAKFAEVTLQVEDGSSGVQITRSGYHFRLELDGKPVTIAAGGTLEVKSGGRLKIVSVELSGAEMDLPVNLRGWVPPEAAVNTGDDRGHTAVVTPDGMLNRYSVRKEGLIYPITVENTAGKEVAHMYISIIM